MKTFYIPYQMLAFFHSKERGAYNGEYQFTLAHRIYLYLLHYKSGRIHKSSIKEIVSFFSSHKRSVLKALKHLEEKSLVKETENYFESVGKNRFKKIHMSTFKDKVEFEFTEQDLLDLKRFKAKVFSSVGNVIAKKKGRKLITQFGGNLTKDKALYKRHKILKVKGQLVLDYLKPEDNPILNCPYSTQRDRDRASYFEPSLNWTQQQGSRYLSMIMGRGRKTIINNLRTSNKLEFIKNNSIGSKTVFINGKIKKIKIADSVVLTDGGFSSNNFAKLRTFDNYFDAKEVLNQLQSSDFDLINKTFIKKVRNSYYIMKALPNTIVYKLKTKNEC